MFKFKPYHLLLISSITLLLVTIRGAKHFHDNYFITAHTYVLWGMAGITLIVWLLYGALNKLLFAKWLSWLHIIPTILISAGFVQFIYFSNAHGLAGMPRFYYNAEISPSTLYHYATVTERTGSVVLAFLLVQIIFVVNFVAGVIRKVKKRTVE